MSSERRYPAAVVVAHSAVETIWRSVHEEYRRAEVEWGGLLWGEVRRDPEGKIIVVVRMATKGRCRASRTSCEILPESWPLGQSQLPAGSHWANVGDYHSHPDFGVFMSGPDCASFWAWGHLPHWVGCVIDPLRQEVGMFVKCSATEYHRVRGYWITDARLRAALDESRGPRS